MCVRADGLISVTPLYSGLYNCLFKSCFDVPRPGPRRRARRCASAATGGTARHSLAPGACAPPAFTYLRAGPVPPAVFARPRNGGRGRRVPAMHSLPQAAGPSGRTGQALTSAANPARATDPVLILTPFEQLLHYH